VPSQQVTGQSKRLAGKVSIVVEESGIIIIDLPSGASVRVKDVLPVYREDRLVARLRVLSVNDEAAGAEVAYGQIPQIGDEVHVPMEP